MTDTEIAKYIIEQLKGAGLEKEADHLSRASGGLDWYVGVVHCVIADGSDDGVRKVVDDFIRRLLDDKADHEKEVRRLEDLTKQMAVFLPFVADTAMKIKAELRKRHVDVGEDGLLVLTGAVILSASRF